MAQPLNLLEETLGHFQEGARSVRAYTNETTYIITKAENSASFWVTVEEPSFPKTQTTSLAPYFTDVFGIDAKY